MLSSEPRKSKTEMIKIQEKHKPKGKNTKNMLPLKLQRHSQLTHALLLEDPGIYMEDPG